MLQPIMLMKILLEIVFYLLTYGWQDFPPSPDFLTDSVGD
jgi:hypothetical protein